MRPAGHALDYPFSRADATQALMRVSDLLALGPRDAGTPGAERAARWIAAQLREAGLENARVESFEDLTPDGPAMFHNVLAEWPGTSAERIVLMSHFDTKAGIGTPERLFQGANDSGSSTGLLLELGRVIARSGAPGPCGILFVFTDGEECRYGYSERDGLHGSRSLAARLRKSRAQLRAVILMDMIGDRDLQIAIPRNGTPALQRLAFEAAVHVGFRSCFSLMDSAVLDDHQPFLDAGYPAVNLIDFAFGSRPGANDFWHTPDDTIDKLSPESLYITGRVVLEMVRRLQLKPL
jgi:glutaminyl-peptide cyclotransferase